MDVAVEILERICQTLPVDDRGLVRRPGGFTWWAGPLAHHVDVGPPFVSRGEEYYAVTSRVPVLWVRGVDAAVERAIGRANLFSNSFSYVYDRDEGEVFLLQRAVVSQAGVDWRPRWLALQFALQLHQALTHCDWLCRTVEGGKVAASHPPGRRSRKQAPELLTTVHARVLLAGRPVVRCVGDFEFGAIRDVADSYGVSATISGDGVRIEWPIGSGTAQIWLSDRQRHPGVGAGLAMWLELPGTDSLAGAARFANWLNLRLARVNLRAVQHGSWGVGHRTNNVTDSGWSTVYCRFIPIAFYNRGLALEAAVDLMQKARRLDVLLHPPGRPTEADSRRASSLRSPTVPAGLHA